MMDASLREAIIFDYARRRPGYGFDAASPHDAVQTRSARRRNPLCGDEVEVRVQHTIGDRPTIISVRWEGRGCVVSQASAAMLSSSVRGYGLAELRVRSTAVRAIIADPAAADAARDSGTVDVDGHSDADTDADDIDALAGIGRLPLRARCATLAWDALDEALAVAPASESAAAGPLTDPGRAPH